MAVGIHPRLLVVCQPHGAPLEQRYCVKRASGGGLVIHLDIALFLGRIMHMSAQCTGNRREPNVAREDAVRKR